MLKFLQVKLQQYTNCELPDVQAEFRKGRGTRDQVANILWILKKEENSRKTSISVSLSMLEPSVENSSRWKYQTTLPASWETCMQVKKEHLEPNMKQQTGSKLAKE